ncbi:MAG: sugar transferase [candidate division Zixibacteria bacterium]|nr:sugar transferase [candidate division Zixibacteria bacterium]
MRYQSPIANPFNQYWEEQVLIGGNSRLLKNAQATASYIYGEYILANIVLFLNLVAEALNPRPVAQFFSIVYHEYGLKWAIKRTIDIIGSLVGLVIATPFFIIMPILIKLDSPGPVFYCQERIGQNRRRKDRRQRTTVVATEKRAIDRRQRQSYGRPFNIIKFRTMRQDAEKQSGPVWATKRDPRITRLGAIMRATRIDEIPQLINVLKGDMSLVGPRPERAFFIDKLRLMIDGYERRLLVKPGLTGLAQVEHKYDESDEDVKIKVKYDISYIYNFRILNDIKIMFKTIYVVLAAKGM